MDRGGAAITRGVSILAPIVAAVLTKTVGGLEKHLAPAQSHPVGCGLLDQIGEPGFP